MIATVDVPPILSSASEHIRLKLAGPAPVKFADLKKGLKAPPKKSGLKLDDQVRDALAEAVRGGQAFTHPSGKAGAERYWSHDEHEAVRRAVLAAAAEPRTVAELKKSGTAGLKSDPGFAESVVRELIGEDRLFEQPAKTKAGGPRFAVTAPPPPLPVLARGKFPGRVVTLAKSMAKLLADAGVSADELFAVVRGHLPGAAQAVPPDEKPHPEPPAAPAGELGDLILKAVEADRFGGVLSLADLRAEMPAEYRGPAFDAAVLRLAAARRVRIIKDADPAVLTPAERAGFVADDHGHVFRTIARREETA